MHNQTSPVMNETLSVIDEHITDMNTPRHSLVDRRMHNSSSYDRDRGRLSFINGEETDEEEHHGLTEEEVSKWSPDRVAEYLEDVGVEKKHCEVFKEQEISGEVLLGMEQSSIFLKEFDLGPVGRRLKTWHKIKALQQEASVPGPARSVSDYSGADDQSSEHRVRSVSSGAMLPRIPSLMEGRRISASEQSPQLRQMPFRDSNSRLSTMTSSSGMDSAIRRPSAASIRSMNHNRRHSSIDANPNGTPITPSLVQSVSPKASHKSQSSLDRSWTMAGGPSPASRPASGAAQSPRPLSTSHTPSMSADGASYDYPERDIDRNAVSSIDLDRGYLSAGEPDGRSTYKKVLSKRGQNGDHVGITTKRRSGTLSHLRLGSTDSGKDSLPSMDSPAAKIYYGATFRGKPNSRSASGPEFAKKASPMQDIHPTVTKLDYGNQHSIDAIAASPHIGEGSETSSIDKPSPIAPSHNRAFFPTKSRAMGLRAISDAITGHEKALISPPLHEITPSPVTKDSPLQSPASRAGSSTPSGTSKSFELENQEGRGTSLKHRDTTSSAGGGLTPSTAATRRVKTKKQTSAYTRGLEHKSPAQQMQGCDYSGWMKKRSSNLMTTWKPRLFVLRGRRLSYYYSEDDTEEKGLIDISNHRVLPANNERVTSLHATVTGATTSPTSPSNPTVTTAAAADAAAADAKGLSAMPGESETGMFIFKLVPPRTGLSKAVNFTKPTVHYFAVDGVQLGRLWMAALMKATIERDWDEGVVTTYNQKTVSLGKAVAMRQRPPELMDTRNVVAEEEEHKVEEDEGHEQAGLGIDGVEESLRKGSDATTGAAESVMTGATGTTGAEAEGEGRIGPLPPLPGVVDDDPRHSLAASLGLEGSKLEA